MNYKKSVLATLFVLIVFVLQGCSSGKPPHFGFFLKDSSGLAEMTKFQGPPNAPTAAGIPKAKDNPPIVVVWQQNVNLDRLVLLSKLGDQDNGTEIPYDATPKEEGVYELHPKAALDDGGYCYVQGDPLSAPYHLDTWCFIVGQAVANIPVNAQPTAPGDTPTPAIQSNGPTSAETKTVMIGNGGRFMSIQLASRTDAEAAWKRVKENQKVVAGWLGVDTLNVYVSSTENSLDDQIMSAVGPGALLKLDEIAGPALVSDPASNTVLSSGGVMLLQEVDADKSGIQDSTNEQAFAVMGSRLKHLSGASFWLQALGHEKILLLLGAGVNTEDANGFVKQRAFVEFVDLAGEPLPEGNIITTDQSSHQAALGAKTYHTFLTGDAIADALPVQDSIGQAAIKIHFTPDGESKMLDYTKNNIGKYIAVVLDGRILTAPLISQPVGNDIVISSNFTPQERDQTALWFKFGALQKPYKTFLSATLSKVEMVHP